MEPERPHALVLLAYDVLLEANRRGRKDALAWMRRDEGWSCYFMDDPRDGVTLAINATRTVDNYELPLTKEQEVAVKLAWVADEVWPFSGWTQDICAHHLYKAHVYRAWQAGEQK